MHLPDGTLLQGGKYKIVRFISSGGFGCTYEAEHVMLEKNVAVKEFFVKDFCNRDEMTAHVTVGTTSKRGLVDKLRAKFIDEAKALSRLQHPNIVRVSDVFEENGTAYFVMDFIDGSSLGEILKREGHLSEQRALKYIRQAAEALRHVHAHNRLHLDVKPGNIMIDRQDNAVLIDFGASKQYDEQDGENTSTLMGKTPGYAPLEQMGNDVVKFTPATDIYALGATLYKLITGITPMSATLIASGETLAPLPDTVSKKVAEAVFAAMRTNKLKRPQSIDKFLAIINSADATTGEDEVTIIDGKPKRPHVVSSTQKQQQPKKDKSSSITVAAVLCLLIAFVGMCLYLNYRGDDGEDTEQTEEPTSTWVQDQPETYNGITFTYTGPVNEDGAADGTGKGVYTAGTYDGEYVDNCRQGEGVFVTADGSNTFEGTFQNDEYYEGTLTWEDGSYYIGTFKNGNLNNGKLYNKDGSFDSEVKNGKA